MCGYIPMAEGRPVRMAAIGALSLTLLIGCFEPALAASAPGFVDVPAGYWAAPYIQQLQASGVLEGVGQGRFDPQGQVTRAQWAAMLQRLEHAPADTVGPRFVDVPAGAWFQAPVAAASGLGWMEGTAPGVFAPDDPVTRAQAAVSLANVLSLEHVAQDESGASLPFADAAQIPAWARGAMAVANHLGLVQGVDGLAEPNAVLTRAQAAALLVRLEGVTQEQLRQEGARVAVAVHVDTPSLELDLGRVASLHAYALDAQGYLVPADFTWDSSAGSLTRGTSSATATLSGASAGTVTVRASVVGGTATGSQVLTITQPQSLVVAEPPAVLAAQPWPLHVEVLDASGRLDPGSGGRTATVTLTPASGAPLTASATLQGGQATLTVPALPLGSYSVSVQAAGLTVGPSTLTAVAAPLGRIEVHPRAGASPSVTAGGQLIVDGAVSPSGAQTAGPWPLQLAVHGRQEALPPLVGEGPPPEVLALAAASSELPGSGGPVAVLSAQSTGEGTLEVSVPGGALSPTTLAVSVQPIGTFGTVTDGAGVAGQPVDVSVTLPGSASAAPVYLEPVDPAGHPHPWVQAVLAGGSATATFTPRVSGTWTLRWYRFGYAPLAAGQATVAPGPEAQLVVDPTPTSVLLPGQQVQLKAWIADALGNPISVPFTLEESSTGQAAAGTMQWVRQGGAGPTDVASYQAGQVGTEVLTFSARDHPALAPVTVTMRTIANRADRVAGKGGWLIFPDWRYGQDAQILAQAKSLGLTHLYLEVATTSDGFYGGRAMDDFIRQAHAQGLALIAWVYAGLEDPAKDTRIVQEVAQYTTPEGDRPDGVALDLEEVLTPSVVAAYAQAADAAEGPTGLVVAVPYPPAYGPHTPFSALAPYVQVIAPMDYWHIYERDYTYSEVYHWVANSISVIHSRAGAGMPVEVIAQTYDAFAGGSGQGLYSPSPLEVAAAMRAASAAGAVGVSFYRPATATPGELEVMSSRPWPDS